MTRREEIITAARELLEQEGPPVTMRRLAERLGIQAPSLYKHFRDKGALEQELAAAALEELGRAIEQAAGLAAHVRTYRAWALAHPHLYRLAVERAGEESEARAAGPILAAVGDPNRARAAWAFAHGMVELELAGRFPSAADLAAAWAAGIRAFETEAPRIQPPPRAVHRSFGVD
jgi:AcrR family transcriptional regulator